MDEHNTNSKDEPTDINKIFSEDIDSKVIKHNDINSVGSYP